MAIGHGTAASRYLACHGFIQLDGLEVAAKSDNSWATYTGRARTSLSKHWPAWLNETSHVDIQQHRERQTDRQTDRYAEKERERADRTNTTAAAATVDDNDEVMMK